MSSSDPFATIDTDSLSSVTGGYSWSDFGHDALNLGKAAVNGGANTLEFLREHPISVGAGPKGSFSVNVGGDNRINAPFHNDPLSQIGKHGQAH
jgi:hypothetical protein